MKVNKKIIGIIMASALMITFVGCSNDSNNVENNTDNNIETTISLDNIQSYEDVKQAYTENFEKIMNKETLQELDYKNITLDTILEYANKGVEIANTIEKNGDKISTIEKLVVLNDLANNTTQEVVKDTLKYIISEYENGNLEKEPIKNLYITRFLDIRLDKLPNLSKADEMVFDMYQICKDSIRGLKDSIESNKDQVNEVIEFVKGSLN